MQTQHNQSFLGLMKPLLYEIASGAGKEGFGNTILVEVIGREDDPIQYEVVWAPFGHIAAEEMDYLEVKYPGCCLIF